MIGILGGTFDPIHYGHLRTALDVMQQLGLKELRFIPLRDPPHRGQPLSTPEQRLAMVEAAIAAQPGFRVDSRELEREGPSYTVDTLHSLRQALGETPICLLLGTDAFLGLPSWHRPEEIMGMAHLVVMQRPGETEPHTAQLDALLAGRHASSADELRTAPGGRVLFQTVTQLEISATAIREMVQRGESPRFLLPEPVLEIIGQQQLYRNG
jgi:nicotinate-nucleotide adenylyltransferase